MRAGSGLRIHMPHREDCKDKSSLFKKQIQGLTFFVYQTFFFETTVHIPSKDRRLVPST